MDTIKTAIVSCLFLGRSPVAPGTAGTLGGVAAALLLPEEHFAVWALGLCAVLYAVGWSLAPWCEKHEGRKDPGVFVLDEVIGYLITVCWVTRPAVTTLIVAFFLFRFLDIWKPWPGRRLEALGGGHGIILDDVSSGVWGWLVLAAIRVWGPPGLLP